MTLPPPLTLPFWFQPNPPVFLPIVDRLALVILVALVIVGVLALVFRLKSGMEKLTRRALGRAGSLLLSAGFSGLLLYAFLFERVPFLSMRIFWLVWAVWLGIAAYKLARYVMVEIPNIQRERAEREKFEKWLPKKKS